MAIVVNFGTLTPAKSNTPASATGQFRIRAKSNTGYKVTVSSVTFTATTLASTDGGTTIAASDIGVGITSIATAPGFTGDLPRADVIATGLNYNPATVTAVNGLTPYTGSASGKATLQDLVSNPNLTILSGNRVASKEKVNGNPSTTDYLQVTMTFGVIPQYFTPANFSAVITLQLAYGP